MTDKSKKNKPGAAEDFEAQADQPPQGIISEFWYFLCNCKRWWMTPIIVILLLISLFAILSTTPLGPAIYTMF